MSRYSCDTLHRALTACKAEYARRHPGAGLGVVVRDWFVEIPATAEAVPTFTAIFRDFDTDTIQGNSVTSIKVVI